MVVLDQRRLPDEEVELRCASAAEVADAIRTLAVRGAPAIGVAAGYGLALAAERGEDPDAAYVTLVSSRPTAVNLRWALDELRRRPHSRARPCPARRRGRALQADGGACPGAARAGGACPDPLQHRRARDRRLRVALGAIRAAFEDGRVRHVWVDETRPLLQGARLTAWELETLGIPFSVIVDGAAASLMAAGEVDAVFTGADRIAANGDVANKVGTYGLAVSARHHALPFYVVAPTSTVDPATASGAAIPIEERERTEISSRFPPTTRPST